jgi:diaminohydroxyphosphoribosylaminopyrimidine deaminase/5-amino-6-(5-phosphoribosylamino)uracil reductase
MTRGRPFVSIKLGASLDGRTGMASGESQWITAVESRRDVHRLRAEAGAVLTGSMTVLADDPRMTVRDFVPPVGPSGVMRQPDRIVLDTHARTPETARIWATDARRFWLTVREPRVVPEGVERIAIPFDGERLDLDDALEALSAFGINEVLAECGPVLAGALLRANLVDELVVYLAPALLGADARGLAVMPGLDRLDERIRLRYTDVRQIGPDIRITGVPETAPRKS